MNPPIYLSFPITTVYSHSISYWLIAVRLNKKTKPKIYYKKLKSSKLEA